MNLYEAVIRFKKLRTKEENETRALFPPKDCRDQRDFVKDAFADVNRDLGVRCDESEMYSFFFWEAEKGRAKVIFCVDMDQADVESAGNYICKFLMDNYDVCDVQMEDITEVTSARFHQLGVRGDDNGYIRNFRHDECHLNLDFRENHQYQVKEELIPDEELTLEEAKKRAGRFMAEESFYEELDRIYSGENEKKFYGNPVHYKIKASNMDAAMMIAELLAHALKANCRLSGSRLTRVYEIREGCYDEDEFRCLFESASGNIVLLDLSGSTENHGNYADAYDQVNEYISGVVSKNHVKTLCVFVENTDHPGFTDSLMSKVAENLDIIEIKEGCGKKDEVINLIRDIAKKDDYELSADEVAELLPDKSLFTVGEAYEVYNKWFRNGLRNKVYKSYKYCTYMSIKKEDRKSEPYDELQKMIGLTEIKKMVDEVIDSARIQKMRSDMGMDSYKTSLHMVFTGNPGSAKTTVARLLAQIFTKEGILASGKYVECGRADLVGRYVGWTAKNVREKFREAKGGILFIDEAYSLVDGSHSFGDEAINTIVQEMENHRDDVIVIFAGYPDKMKEFLDKNEGLRSRIAFHLDFPDYNADELVDILKLMAKAKGYRIDSRIEDKCRSIFAAAVKQKEFGNGRYARNLLEQAMMAQSRRIISDYKDRKITRRALTTLKTADFEVNASKQADKEKNYVIGFAG